MICKKCGTQFETAFCPNCGTPAESANSVEDAPKQGNDASGKTPKKKKRHGCLIVILVFFALGLIGSLGGKTDKTANETTAAVSDQNGNEAQKGEPTEAATEEQPDIEIHNDFERLVWKTTKEAGGQLTTINTTTPEGANTSTVITGVLIENDEDKVNSYLNQMAELVKNDSSIKDMTISFGDKEKGADAPLLLMGVINEDGSVETSMESMDYKSKHNQWIAGQFSAWDGSNATLVSLVKKRLNDEDSFKHIKTTYRDVKTEAIRDEINKILSDAGVKNKVAVGDLFVMMEFSAKNGFNATIKNTAYAISNYETNSVTLLKIE